MIRQHIREHIPERIIGDPLFRWRGSDVSRIEALTDMVFAFALTLLVVSLEVPRIFDDLVLVWPLHWWHGWRTGSTAERLAAS